MSNSENISRLINQLGHDDEELQRRAIKELVAIGLAAVPQIIGTIRADDPLNERQGLYACYALGQIKPRSANENPGPLVAALKDADTAVRRNAATALGNFGEVGGAALLTALGDEDSGVRNEISRTLAKLANEGHLIVPALIDALDGADHTARWTAVRFFFAMDAPLGELAVPALIRAFREAKGTERLEVVDALYFSAGPAAIPALKDALRSDYAAVRAGSSEALGRILCHGLRSGDSVSDSVKLFTHDIVSALTVLLCDKEVEVVVASAEALGWIGGPEVAPAVPSLIALLSDQRRPVHRAAASTLASLGLPATAEAVPVLVALLTHDNPSLRETAAETLGELKVPADGGVVQQLLELLEDQAGEVRFAAALALAKIDPYHAIKALPVLGDVLNGDDEDRQLASLRVLSQLGLLAAPLVPDLIRALRIGQNRIKCWAAAVLGKVGSRFAQQAVPALEDALTHWDEDVRAAAADALGEIGLPAAASAIPRLREAINDRSEEVRTSAAEALAKLGQPISPDS